MDRWDPLVMQLLSSTECALSGVRRRAKPKGRMLRGCIMSDGAQAMGHGRCPFSWILVEPAKTLSCAACVSSLSFWRRCAPVIEHLPWLQTTPSPLSSGEMDGSSRAAMDSPGAQYRRRKQLEQEQHAGLRPNAGSDDFRTASERSSAESSATGGSADYAGDPVPDSADGAGAPAAPEPESAAMTVPATAAGQLQRVRDNSGGSSPPTPQHAGTRGRGPLAFGPGDGTRGDGAGGAVRQHRGQHQGAYSPGMASRPAEFAGCAAAQPLSAA